MTRGKSPIIGIDLFAGAGGLSLGATWAGVDVRLAVDCDPHSVATYRANHPNTTVYANDIRNLKKIDIASNGAPRILFGGPPCQGFSTSNQRTRGAENPDNWLFQEFLRIAKLWMPEWVVLENVAGMTDSKGRVFLEKIIHSLSKLGYTVHWWVLNAVDFGVPQRRSRLFVVGSIDGIKLSPPKSTSRQHVTVRDAISDLPDLENGADEDVLPYSIPSNSAFARKMRGKLRRSSGHLVTRNASHILKRYEHIPQGGNWEDIPARLMKTYSDSSRCHTGIYHRLNEDEPSVVIGNFRKNMLIHPRQNRGLSVREAARIQSFPDCYEFRGSIGFQQQQVGNAVPPILAKVVFDTIRF